MYPGSAAVAPGPRRPGGATGRASIVRIVLALLVCAPWVAPVHARGRDTPDPEWREGPVRYLLTRPEAKVYKELKDEKDRRDFIKQFWKRRDPTPETPVNEFRDEFWRRVSAANDLFDDTAREGWITDRGKIYILLGPPSDTVSEEVARSHRGIILWIYQTVWAKEIGPNFVVAFAKDVTGEFRISTAPSVDADVFRGLAPNTPLHLMGAGDAAAGQINSSLGIARTDPLLVAQGMPSSLSELSLLADLGRLQQTEQLVLNEYVSAQALFGDLPVIASVDYYKANDGTTYSAISVSLKSKSVQYADHGGIQAPRVSVYARLEDPETGELLHSFEGESDFVASPDNPGAGPNDYLTWQAGAGLPPRNYRAVVTVHDRVAEKVGTYPIDMTVPDFDVPGLSLSSITLAERLARIPEPVPTDRKRPFAFGQLQVLPKPGIAYAADQELAFYFQVYGARTDAQSGSPLLDLRYSFDLLQEGEFEPFGPPLDLPGQAQASQGFSFPLTGWSLGRYRLTVKVTDRLNGATTERQVEFLVR